MGLRIGTNSSALTALRNLREADRTRAGLLEKLSTGRSINRGSDNPSGLILLEQLNAQTRQIGQAIENTQSASNLINTAEGGLSEISDLLIDMKADVIASLNTGALGPAQQGALQRTIDQRINSIDRIASTTRFGDLNLLNGNLGFNVTNASPELTNINVNTVNAAGPLPLNVNINVTAAATQGTVTGTISAAPQVGATTFRVQGNIGTQEITVAAGATQADVIAAINSVTDFTGVEATAGGQIVSSEVGSDQFARVEFVTGDLDGITESLNFGTDVQAVVNGASVTGQGNTIQVEDGVLSGQFTVQQGFTGNASFEITSGGARFQTGTGVTDALRVGFAASGAFTLGGSSGVGALASLKTGGANSLANNPAGALSIISAAQTEVSTQRANIGAIDAQLLQSNRRSLGVQLENLLASASRIGDLDFAQGITDRNRADVIFSSSLSVLKSANLNAGQVLKLLGG